MSKYPSHEQTLVLIKPDAIQRGIVGEILTRLERTGLKIVGMKMIWVSPEEASEHYADMLQKYGQVPFDRTVKMLSEAPLVALVLHGHHAIEVVRKIVGSTFPKDAMPGTIRGDFAHISKNPFNMIHASSSPEDAVKEIKRWFNENEIHEYQRNDERHILGPTDEDLT